ncbi:hypothetical protein GOBAR_AA24423 [Gossypium barbadense]|uniref:Uncharacterized protein n=1 Tax=Gossypium barbadense TaxID=3634 RepID=A0A2P5WYU5_GOSBA|nr:hypothetical protein GOBAR_AA24423 [Gossypium barbadense]
MAGGSSRRQEGSLVINNTNVFAALETLRRKKKSDKDRGSSKKSSSKSQQQPEKEAEPQVFWAPAPLTGKSMDGKKSELLEANGLTDGIVPNVFVGTPKTPKDLDSESEEDILEEGDDDIEEDHDHEPESQVHPEPVLEKAAEALLADFGVTQKESNGQDESHDAVQENKDGKGEKKENPDQPTCADATTNGPDEVAGTEQTEEDASAIDVKERLKKVASMKKKKSSKEMDAAAKAAAQEAAARSARLAAAKKKEKNHYNQQPVR